MSNFKFQGALIPNDLTIQLLPYGLIQKLKYCTGCVV